MLHSFLSDIERKGGNCVVTTNYYIASSHVLQFIIWIRMDDLYQLS
jgi:hypothetical protein